MKSLFKDALNLTRKGLPRRFSFMDIGARGGIGWPWSKLPADLLSVILVEPDPKEAEKLQKEFDASGGGMVLPVALWRNTDTLTLHLNRWPATSSLYESNNAFLDQFPESDRFDPLETATLSTRSIDALAESANLPAIDFIKVDVQGAELAILEGGVKHLAANLIGIEIEVEFAEMYTGQPLFGEVDTFIREKLGLELWDLQTVHWKYKAGMHVPGARKGRLIFGDALYLRSLTGIEAWLETMPAQAATEKVAMLIVAALSYGYMDYAYAVLNAPSLSKYIDQASRETLGRALASSGSGLRPFRNGNGHVYWILNALAQAFRPTYNGWAYGGSGLGNRRRGPFWR